MKREQSLFTDLDVNLDVNLDFNLDVNLARFSCCTTYVAQQSCRLLAGERHYLHGRTYVHGRVEPTGVVALVVCRWNCRRNTVG